MSTGRTCRAGGGAEMGGDRFYFFSTKTHLEVSVGAGDLHSHTVVDTDVKIGTFPDTRRSGVGSFAHHFV